MLYSASLWWFGNYQFVLLNSFTFFAQHPQLPPIWQLSVCSLYLWVCFGCLFYSLDSTYKWNHIIFVCVWLISFSIIPSRSAYVVTSYQISFFLTANWYSNVFRYHFFIHSPTDGHLGCFHMTAIVNDASMKIGMYVSFRISILDFFRYIPRSGISGS